MSIGKSALNASQAWISVTGNNIANADTEGYSRQYVDQRDSYSMTTKPGAQGMGVNAQQVLRYYDAFLERSYVRQSTVSSRWNEQDTIMTSLEGLFNESNRSGLNSAMGLFFEAWQDLALYPDSTAHREALLSYADSMRDMFSSTVDSIKQLQSEMDKSIDEAVSRVNEISKAIAELNKQITANTVDGISNPNNLYDERDRLVRELATLVDVETVDNGKGNFQVQLTTGQPLVDGQQSWEIEMLGPQAENRLKPESTYQGQIEFDGSDGFEYTVEIVNGGNVGDTPPPQFRVSLDGGKTWLRDDNGQELRYDITDNDGDGKVDPVQVKNLTISFTDTQNFHAGDCFDIVPKRALYWIEPTRGPENITPQQYLNGTENTDRVTGGKLASYFNIRDDNCNRYLDEVNATAEALIWEVNRLHSQGVGLKPLDYAQGTQTIGAIDQALGSPQAMHAYSDRLQAGNVNFHFYDKTTGDHVSSGMLDFDDATPGIQNFDPSVHTLEDVRKAINTSFPDGAGNNMLNATIQDGRLLIEANPDSNVSFAMGADSSGLMAALGINSFFSGSNAVDMAVNDMLYQDADYVAAGRVNGQYQMNVGDNSLANDMGLLSTKNVVISTVWKTVDNQSITSYYSNLVTTVGSDRLQSKTNAEYNTTLTQDLDDRVASVSGVNLDEELANLIKYQSFYTAAAKLITTADQMLETLLGLKQ
ncbi:flagellar hook-associated protein FlgK [uncultured Desulfovibrio sp.]|uniref:flagellar hook-associated protein FlgK n=1 Tax=uncultured Desulfovibrio sp. TaxID=167968 RepID=UPI002620ACC4|nr:flagellar hook-associated protein FlgK [uncultured Desulfovibrio sp.]